VDLLLSGPAAGVGALTYYAQTTGISRLISMEIGGTSTDVMLMNDANVGSAEQIDIAGYTIARSAIEIHTVGAGGGTIARVDEAGMLRVGPRGAGAQPGPACYGRGGGDPTVTDAQLLLGRLRPGAYAGGSMRLELELARRAIAEEIAQPLGLSEQNAAAGIIRLASQRMAQAVEKISIQRGIDPRRFTLVACGGAGPMHGVEVARLLDMRQVHVPRQSGAFCAFGMLNSDMCQEFERPVLERLDEGTRGRLDATIAELTCAAESFLKTQGFPLSPDHLTHEADMRYAGQQWSLRLPLTRFDGDVAIRKRFEAEYDLLFGHVQPGGTIEITAFRVVARGKMAKVPLVPLPTRTGTPTMTERRPVYFDSTGSLVDTPVVPGTEMAAGMVMPGPVIVEEATTTVVVAPDDLLQVDRFGDYLIRIGPASQPDETQKRRT
jgi:N-methylhydantoinase A